MNKGGVVIKLRLRAFLVNDSFWSQWLFFWRSIVVKVLRLNWLFFEGRDGAFQDFGHFLMIWAHFLRCGLSFHITLTLSKIKATAFHDQGETSMIKTNFDWGRFLIDVHFLPKIKSTITLIYFSSSFSFSDQVKLFTKYHKIRSSSF